MGDIGRMDEVAEQYDVVVVGGGTAGLSAGLVLARSRRRVVVVDAGEPRNAPSDGVHAFLTRDGVPPAELAQLGRDEVESYGGELRAGRAVSASRDGDVIDVRLEDGTTLRTRRLVVASGVVDELPDVPGLREGWGHDVVHCPYCHGWEVRDQRIGVLVCGPMAGHQSLLFRQLTDDLTLLRNGQDLAVEDLDGLVARGVRVVDQAVAELERDEGGRLVGARLADGSLVPLDVVTVQPRLVARSPVLDSLGVPRTPVVMADQVIGHRYEADPLTFQAAPGVWLAGNVTDPSGQVVHAAGAGVRAGAVVNADLAHEDARLALDAAPAG
jgi:thioredoxin reductase